MPKRIVVPEGMLKVLKDSLASQYAYVVDGHGGDLEYALGPALEAALLWLSENPIVPTENQWAEVLNAYDDAGKTGYECAVLWEKEWQRRMFLAPEPEVPEEIADLLVANDTVIRAYTDPSVQPRTFNSMLIEAYRRGQRSRA